MTYQKYTEVELETYKRAYYGLVASLQKLQVQVKPGYSLDDPLWDIYKVINNCIAMSERTLYMGGHKDHE